MRDNFAVMRALQRRPWGAEQAGFTLIEVMIAMSLMLIGIAGVLQIQTASVRATSFSRHATEATIVAEDKMEELMTIAAADLQGGSDVVNSQAVDDADGLYTRSWTIQSDGTSILLTIQVGWLERGSEDHSISVATQRRL